jgi:hypothetical protein
VLFARNRGDVDWCCPACEHVNFTVFKALHKAPYKALYCADCHQTWYPGMVLYKAPMGPKPLPPRDTLMIGGGFPLKREVNRIYCSNCTEEILPQVLEKMVHHDLTPIVHSGKKPRVKPQPYQSPVDIPDPDELIG